MTNKPNPNYFSVGGGTVDQPGTELLSSSSGTSSQTNIRCPRVFVDAEKVGEIANEFTKLLEECERILGIGFQQNTLPRFKKAVQAAKDYLKK